MDMVDAMFAWDLTKAVGAHAFTFPDDNITLSFKQSAIISESRNGLCQELLEAGCDYILFLDTDMRFPQDLIARMLAHDKPVLAANCAKRRRPISPTAKRERADDPSKLEGVWPDKDVLGLEQIAVVGTAVMMIRSDVLLEMPYPWFDTPYIEADNRWVGEDVYFCAKLRQNNTPLYIDHKLSWEIGHMGQYTFEMKDVLAEREMANAGLWDHLRDGVEIPKRRDEFKVEAPSRKLVLAP
jgi:hypothetical protein